MDFKLFLIFVVILSAVYQGPAVYRNLTCVEYELGYVERMLYYLTTREMVTICPTRADLIWRIGNEVFCTFLSVLLTLILSYTPLVENITKERSSAVVTMFQKWRNGI
ncbi:uncharacterized protein LOC132543175 [Ylistrum balloti]|uniref:uncharacterized protein LOC132543175 n=1 Tax=Ylistrum balloti TaxID=509963 RepID=UPI002905DA52|nr:uncharacterized protein LOC132543175 [Ylistrum balloti]